MATVTCGRRQMDEPIDVIEPQGRVVRIRVPNSLLFLVRYQKSNRGPEQRVALNRMKHPCNPTPKKGLWLFLRAEGGSLRIALLGTAWLAT